MQADLSLRWAHMSDDMSSHVTVQMFTVNTVYVDPDSNSVRPDNICKDSFSDDNSFFTE